MVELRAPSEDELKPLSALCLRSKAVWGYDDAFMAACRSELTLTAEDLRRNSMRVAEDSEGIVGLVQVRVARNEAFLEKLFVEPTRMRTGAGRCLFEWAVLEAKSLGAERLVVESDPDAVEFYRRMGAHDAGSAPSGSIPGRLLPRLELDL